MQCRQRDRAALPVSLRLFFLVKFAMQLHRRRSIAEPYASIRARVSAGFPCPGRILTGAKHDILPNGIGKRIDQTRRSRRPCIGMNADSAEIMAKTGSEK